MDGFVTKFISEMKDCRYIFIILKEVYSHFDIMSILLKKRVMSKDGCITLYAPYKDLYMAYCKKFPAMKMWGIGFQKEALNRANLIGNIERLTYNPQQTTSLRSIKIEAKGLDFAGLLLDKGEVFAVVPNRKEMAKVCFHGSVEVNGKNYYQWWCKGIRNDWSDRRNDNDIEKYLKGDYGRFFWKNYVNWDEKELLPQNRLFGENEKEYSLLNLTPEELQDCSKKEMWSVGTLF